MLIRCAARTMGGMLLLSGLATGLAVTAGTVGAALLAKRLWEERKGWREGAGAAEAEPAGEPAAEAPSA
jgi:hypothetical protein